MKLLRFLVIPMVFLLFNSCANVLMQQSSDRIPSFDPSKASPVFVVHLRGEDHGLDAKIAAALRKRGIAASHGEKEQMSRSANTKLEYYDKWYWDITPYLLQLDMKLFSADSNQLVASGTSRRTSLVRKSEDAMIEEVLNLLLTGNAE